MGATPQRWRHLARERSNQKDCDLPPPTGGARPDPNSHAPISKFDQTRFSAVSVAQASKKRKRGCRSENAAFATGDESAHAMASR
jgi:hypothetical protein